MHQLVGDRLVTELVQAERVADTSLPVDINETGAGGVAVTQRDVGCGSPDILPAVESALAGFAQVYPVSRTVLRLDQRSDIRRWKSFLAVPGGGLVEGAFDVRYGARVGPVIEFFRVEVFSTRQIALPVAALKWFANKSLEPGCRPGLGAVAGHRHKCRGDDYE